MNQIEGEPGRIPLHVIVELLSSLTSPDAIKIFMKASTGIRNSTYTIQELGLTQKRYYVWLKRLIDTGLVEKQHGRYRQTLLGQVCAQLGRSLQDALRLGDRLDLADTLLHSATLSVQEKTTMLRAITTQGSQGLFNITDILYSVKTIVNYNMYINEIIQTLDSCQKDAYLAINKMDDRISDAIFNGIDREVTFYILSTESGFSENLEFLKLILNNPKTTGLVRRMITKEMNIRVVKKLDYGFIVSDEKRGLIEFPHPLSQDFYAAFRFDNPYMCTRLIDIFQALYEGAKEDPRIAFIKKTLGLSTTVSSKM
jgi:sugar-specific transcriptional regulator TrmB